MGYIELSSDDNMTTFLTDHGRKKLLEQGFIPKYFALFDADANYEASKTVSKELPDLSGDYDDNVFSMSKNVRIKNPIIK